jgi:hypothetical protein
MFGAQVNRIRGKWSLVSLGLGKLSVNGRWLIVRVDWGKVFTNAMFGIACDGGS